MSDPVSPLKDFLRLYGSPIIHIVLYHLCHITTACPSPLFPSSQSLRQRWTRNPLKILANMTPHQTQKRDPSNA